MYNDPIQLLIATKNTLNTISIIGQENWQSVLNCMKAIDQAVQLIQNKYELKQPEQKEDTPAEAEQQ